MAETPTGPESPETPDPADAPGAPDGQDDGQADDGMDADALRAALTAARTEAARYRVKARETAEALGKARSPEEFQAVADRATELEAELSRERLARKYSLPPVLAARIAGADDDAREADAKALAAALHGQGGGVGRGGLDPSAAPAPTDPGELAASVPRARR